MKEGDGRNTGVFLCNCLGASDTVDMVELAEYCKALEGVRHVEIFDFLCSPEMGETFRHIVKDYNLDRIVIGACSPRLYLEHFQQLAEEAGINRYMVEMSNLREQCAWIHSCRPSESTEKAKDILASSVARAIKMHPSQHGVIAAVDRALCDGCGVCKTVCRVGAISILPDPDRDGKHFSYVDPAVCEGCGVCVSSCPSGAMDMESFSNEEVLAQIDALTASSNESFPNVLVFACHWCSYAAADLAGMMRIQIDPRFRVIRTICSARVDPEWVIRALSRGADGVLILGGAPGHCHYEVGSLRTRKRMTLLNNLLVQLGLDENRFRVEWVNSDEPRRFREVVERFIEKVIDIGPNPLKKGIDEGVSRLTGWWAERLEKSLGRTD